jgi:hypothetical protein
MADSIMTGERVQWRVAAVLFGDVVTYIDDISRNAETCTDIESLP